MNSASGKHHVTASITIIVTFQVAHFLVDEAQPSLFAAPLALDDQVFGIDRDENDETTRRRERREGENDENDRTFSATLRFKTKGLAVYLAQGKIRRIAALGRAAPSNVQRFFSLRSKLKNRWAFY